MHCPCTIAKALTRSPLDRLALYNCVNKLARAPRPSTPMHLASVSFAVLVLCNHAAATDWIVRATRLTSAPIARGDFTYLYNAAMWMDGDGIRLLERVQSAPAQQPYTVGPSKIAYASLMVDCGQGIPCRVNTTLATEGSLVFQPTAAYEKCGTEDPRIEWHDGLYYLFYTAYDCQTARLALATTTGT